MNRLIKTDIGYYQVLNKPSQDELNKYYAEKYYQQGVGSYEVEYSKEEIDYIYFKIKQSHYLLNKLVKNNNLSVLDVGCGEGFALQYFNNHNWKVKGLDFSSEGISKQNPSMEKYFVKGDIYQNLSLEIKNKNKYDVVWLQNVLEHVLEPEDLLLNLKDLLNSKGIAVITVPNDFSNIQEELLSSNKVNKHYWIALPDHISYFNYQSLEGILKATGWQANKIIADFPIDWFLANEHSNYIQKSNVGKSIHSTRMFIEALIDQQEISDVVKFYEYLAKVGMGRNITVFASLI